ncbi:SAGA complex subunit Sgf73 [Savitreella phatthalungensis]
MSGKTLGDTGGSITSATAAHKIKGKAQKSTEAAGAAAKTTKKRKAEADAVGAPKAKKAPSKTTTTRKVESKARGPVDVERQCGVPLPQGGLCARSLTCKSHSMGAKRAVQGRSQPYDILLAQYQKKNHAKLSLKAAADGAAYDRDDIGPPVDSDEEVSAVVESVARSLGRPAQTKALMPVRRRHRFLLAREMMATALKNNSGHPAIQLHGKYIPFQA